MRICQPSNHPTLKPSLHCLLVDDDPIQLALAKELLGYLGILVEKCSDASKVKELLQHTGEAIGMIRFTPWEAGLEARILQ